MRKPLSLLVGFLCLTSSAGAWDVSPTQTPSIPMRAEVGNPSQDLMQSLYQHQTLMQGIEQLSLSDDGRAVHSMMGRLSEPMSGDLKKAGMVFLREHAQLFNLPTTKNVGIELLSMVEGGGATHLTYGMKVGEVPVHQALVELHVGSDRRVQLTNGAFPTIETIANQIAIDSEKAVDTSKKLLATSELRGKASAELVVFPTSKDKAVMAWFVKIPATQPLGDWELLIDAETGSELSRLNQMVFADPVGTPEMGKGAVYFNHPLAGAPIITDLYNLTTSSLVGLFTNVVNGQGAAAVSDSNYHVYDPADTHFDEVNIYYNINRIHDFFKKFGFTKMDYSIKAEVHHGTNFDNAYFSPQTNSMAFGDGNKLNDLSKEANIAWHEYSHAALQKITTLNYKAESGAMNEGQADYFACTIIGDPLVGVWAMNKMGKPFLRNLSEKNHYPEDIKNEVHQDGRIWGATLWDLRTALGAETSDVLIHKSIYYLGAGSPKFIDGMNAIVTADKNIFGGANAQVIKQVFAARGIGSAPGALTFSGSELRMMKNFVSLHR
ncbi:MAG: M36 family metallopeptidase [Candidatus Ozemobacteraceae bacterium]